MSRVSVVGMFMCLVSVTAFGCFLATVLAPSIALAQDGCESVTCARWHCVIKDPNDTCYVGDKTSCSEDIFVTSGWGTLPGICKDYLTEQVAVVICTDCNDWCPSHSGQKRVCGKDYSNQTNCDNPNNTARRCCKPVKDTTNCS